MKTIIGKQTQGSSSDSIKNMAMRAILASGQKKWSVMADIGAGKGDFTKIILPYVDKVLMVDEFQPDFISDKVIHTKIDLNENWPIDNEFCDLLVSLEVIEHLENPRHFFRECYRVMKKGAYGFISTPNNLNFISKTYFFFTGCHRFFQDNCYPAHITAILPIDLNRILEETGFTSVNLFYNYQDVLPFFGKSFHVRSKHFSNSVGILFKKY